jgi:hypothetical protein
MLLLVDHWRGITTVVVVVVVIVVRRWGRSDAHLVDGSIIAVMRVGVGRVGTTATTTMMKMKTAEGRRGVIIMSCGRRLESMMRGGRHSRSRRDVPAMRIRGHTIASTVLLDGH